MFVCLNTTAYSVAACARKNLCLGIFHSVLSPITLLLNLLLIVAFFKTKQPMSNSSNFLILCILASDLASGALLIPLISFTSFTRKPLGCALPRGHSTILSSSGSVTFLLTIILSANRYLHMNPSMEQPSRISKAFRRPYVYLTAGLVVFFAVSYHTLCLVTDERFCGSHIKSLVDSSILTACLLFFIFSYIHGYLRIRKFVDNSPMYKNQADRPLYVSRLHRHIVALIIFLILGYGPLLTHKFLVGIYGLLGVKNGPFWACVFNDVIIPILLISRLASPAIVLWQNREVRAWVAVRACGYVHRLAIYGGAAAAVVGPANQGSAEV